jgi:hypothetical protein
MRRLYKILGALALLTSIAACASLPMHSRNACYWMTEDGSRWVLMSEVETKKQCFELDSCSGGKGMSGGGCYKWAPSTDAKARPW